jgi:hypothetical protein
LLDFEIGAGILVSGGCHNGTVVYRMECIVIRYYVMLL